MKPGDGLEIECSSSVGPHVAVKWERSGGQPLPHNFEVISMKLFYSFCNFINLKTF